MGKETFTIGSHEGNSDGIKRWSTRSKVKSYKININNNNQVDIANGSFGPNGYIFGNGLHEGSTNKVLGAGSNMNGEMDLENGPRALEDAQDWVFTAIYANPRDDVRQKLWRELSNFANNISIPWCLMGDFNDIANEDEKMGGAPINSSKCIVFWELGGGVQAYGFRG
ncbi:Endonuclease/exonuclease/phosphatase family protein [Quillaja saponaria]|uniref:Endonuclease/exonuclease/phosphatase family protein n=1 Tax=Quillaja saponaria TaxID=32244 RepID=A0AAD7LQ59_QUISA|nr:Endonuclease/exonuclease/phosphatase family protein [Quillaja saponaria]